MLTLDEKQSLWQMVTDEFPSDPMMRDLHFIRALLVVLREKQNEPKSYRDLGVLAREEFSSWLKAHPEIAGQ